MNRSFIVLLLIIIRLYATESNTFKQTIIDEYLQSLHRPLEEQLPSNNSKKFYFNIKPLSSELKQTIIAKALPLPTRHFSPPFINQIGLRDLEVHRGQRNPAHTFIKQIDNSLTAAGSYYLFTVLIQITGPLEDTLKRQACIKQLYNNSTLKVSLQKHLSEYACHENALLALWDEGNLLDPKVIQRAYYKFNGVFNALNNNKYALELLTRLDNLTTVMQLLQVKAILNSVFAHYISGIWTGERVSLSQALKYGIKNGIIDTFHPWPFKKIFNSIDAAINYRSAQHTAFFKSIQDTLRTRPWLTNAVKAWCVFGHYFTIWTYSVELKNRWESAVFLQQILHHLQEQLIHLAQILRTSNELYSLLESDPILSQTDAALCLQTLCKNNERLSLELQELLTLLQSNTFKGSPSFFSKAGNILLAYRKILSCKEEFAQLLFKAIGELDFYQSMSTLLEKNSSAADAKYCFVEFIKQNTPYISLTNFWNPFISPLQAVTNTIVLGYGPTSVPHGIITGPNTAGKSTIMKGVGLATLMACKTGVAPAEKAIMTFIKRIHTYYHVTDDISTNASLFYSGLLRFKDILDDIEISQPDEFIGVFIDEPGRGTSAEKSYELTIDFLRKIAAKSNCFSLTTTHIHELTNLEQTDPQLFTNYCVKVEVQATSTGKYIQRPFKLERGSDKSNIALDLAHNYYHTAQSRCLK